MNSLKFEATLLQKLLQLLTNKKDFSDITDKRVVEAAMLAHPLVDDCVVMVREAEMSRRELVAYVVLAGPFSLSQLQSHLQAVLPAAMLPDAYVPVSTLPLTDLGQVDEQALADLEVLDSNLVQRWQKRLWSVPEVEQVAVVVQEHNDIPPLHLSDLLPDWQTSTSDPLEPVTAAVYPVTVPQEGSKPKALAICHGELLASEQGLPTTLSAVLLKTALEAPKKGIVYLQSNGLEIVQSYAALLEEAEQILAGLRKLGLKPQSRVIFQFDLNQDFIPAFWGCILGGFVPVPISFQSLIGFCPEQPPSKYTTLRSRPEDVSHSNENRHNKLYSAWLMLDRPLILTSSRQATAIRSLANLLGLENLLFETIDDLRSCKPEQNWHESQPDDLAALFLTSGSTGMPKGVMLSHRNIISSVANVAQMNGFSSLDISFNWMPLDHVGSLVRCMTRDVYLGCVSIHAPTETVLQNPLLWLNWIEHYRVTVTWAPNFAFGLINDQAEVIEQRHWDLSSMRFLLNTGEAIVARTARRFLELLAPHGLAATTMYSAWGMSETSSGVTFSNRFLSDSPPKGASFVELGTPIAGTFLRIVDRQNRVLEEDTIGHLQVKGATVTAGYYQNPELNREVFTEDGWFRTGDLGFLHQGRLLITGREKEVIIINGINYYSHEIEAVVEEISGVEVSYTAACAIRTSNSNTDTLAIFFNSPLTEANGLLELLKKIRGKVVRNVGTPVTYLIPVEQAAIPKTAIGKIQREQLKRRFEAGEFNAILKQLDIKSGNGNTLPDWFYRKVWRRKEGRTLLPQPRTGRYLVFLDQSGLGTLLCTKLGELNLPYVGVEAGTDFALLSADRYRLDPKNPDHYCRLLESLSAEKLQIAQILHLWTYDLLNGESSLEALDLAQDQGIYSLLFLVQALAKVQSEHPVWLYVISSQTQPTSSGDQIAYEKAPILGLIKTIPQEMPWVNCCHIDLPVEPVDANAEHLLQELQVVHKEQEVAYRHGQRLVPRLEKADMCQAQKQDLPFQPGGMYLISGGLGGIGTEIAKYLLQHYGVRLLLVGRTPLPEKKTWSAHLEQEDAVAQRIQAYLNLKQLGGEAIYKSVDICDLARLQEVVEQAKSRWQCQLDGVIHLAGIYQGRTLVEETRDSLAATLRPKMLGGWVLHQLLADQPNDGVFISFSSLSSFFGGAMIGGYAAANRFLDCFSHYQRHQLRRSYCFAWSMWDGVGMSRDSQTRDILRAKGHLPMPVKQGLYSLFAGLHYDQAELLVGVEGSNRHIRKFLETSYRLQKLSAYFTAKANPLSLTHLELTVRDRFQTRSICNLLQLQEMPLTAMGEIDLEQLVTMGRRTVVAHVSPRTELEQQLASIWQEVLGVAQVSIYDNFFELGGSSLLAVRLFMQIENILGKKLLLVTLLQAATIEQLSNILCQSECLVSSSSLVAIQPAGSKPPLFCIGGAGGDVFYFRDLSYRLGLEQPVYGLQAQGLDGKQAPHTRIEDMAAHYIKEICTFQPQGPYFLAGHSVGGLVAFEMAQQLQMQGQEVGLLAIFDAGIFKSLDYVPSFRDKASFHLSNLIELEPKNKLSYVPRMLSASFKSGVKNMSKKIASLAGLHQHSLPQDLGGPEYLPQNVRRMFKINEQAARDYLPRVYLEQVTFFRATNNPTSATSRLRWGKLAAGGLEVHKVPGNHSFADSLLSEPNVRVLAERLKACLDKAQKFIP